MPGHDERGPWADDLDGYRTALGEWLDTNDLDEFRGAHLDTVEEEELLHARLTRRLYDAGWNRYGYPVAVGGLGGDARHWAVLYDEIAIRGLPIPCQLELLQTLGPAMAHWAPELAAEYLPAFLRGDEWWGQGFSEPEAGSDLAGLRCRLDREGDGYLLRGQKIWTSHGATSNRLIVLARSGTQESRHRGLTMVLVDVAQPGVTVRPIALANGRRELAECFFDDVVVPPERLVGPEGQGWDVAMYLLQFERGIYAWLRSTSLMQRLRALAGQLSGEPTDARARTVGEVYLDTLGVRARSARTVRALAAGEAVGPGASADKLLLSRAERSVQDAAFELLDSGLAVGDDHELAMWRDAWWYSRTTSIFGGAAEIQRTIIADRVLKLPKE